ncbi:MAG: hypothetical protein M9949_12710 [Candidatus Kapabacteria bacterium]|nr:hypothetical protein [Candidatus Kapabacteria bacterium]
MGKIRILAIIFAVALMASCASTIKFPISQVTPAADITAKIKQDNNNNYIIEITALNLSAASRLNPPKNNYSVWVLVGNGETKNVGQLNHENAEKAFLKTVTPFEVKEIFITAEEQGNLAYPAGVEISRITINDK